MKVDRYTKFVLTIIAVGLWALVINGVIAPQPAIAAGPTEEVQLTRSQLRTELSSATRGLATSHDVSSARSSLQTAIVVWCGDS